MERSPPSPNPAAAVDLVLGDDDLLVEILHGLDSPTWLIRAAAVCRRWLRRASDPAFLRHFRALRPPRVLGLHVQSGSRHPRLLTVPQPQELAAAARRALETLRPSLGAQRSPTMHVLDCRNGRLLVEIPGWPDDAYAVRSLLNQVPDIPIPAPPAPSSFFIGCRCQHMSLLEDDGDSCLSLTFYMDAPKVRADFSILQSGVWGGLKCAQTELEMVDGEGLPLQILDAKKVVMDRKVYVLTFKFILGLDLVTNSFFTVGLPGGPVNSTLSRAQQSGLYLISAKGFELRVWLGDGAGQWVLKNTVSVREACGHLNVPRWGLDDDIWVVDAGDNAEFVFLQLMASEILCCMQLGNRIAERVDGGMVPPSYSNFMYPISMVWPPIFPTLEEANQDQ